MKQLENKIAVVYGDGGVGGAIAKAFAREGAKVFLAGRTPTKLEAIAGEVVSGGGTIETARLDALDEQAVEEHMNDLVRKAGKVDISFNTIGIPQKGVQGAFCRRHGTGMGGDRSPLSFAVRGMWSQRSEVSMSAHHRHTGDIPDRRSLGYSWKSAPYNF